MNLASENKKSFNDTLKLKKEMGYNFKKIWIATYTVDKGKPVICHSEREALGFVDMDYEYTPNILYPSEKGCRCTIGFEMQ